MQRGWTQTATPAAGFLAFRDRSSASAGQEVGGSENFKADEANANEGKQQTLLFG